ncbi:hypothetical protein pipiens_004866 [Culex pipiens pipiens]|uniref:Uncharacterized protein n=1 Tax=Culex pipiens pipiens TaxID=38569 RepID=A0ABD1CDX8_CULPP
MDSLPARNISTREGKLQNSGNHRTDNDIINIAPLQRPTIATSTLASPTSSHRRRATGSVKLTGDSEMFFIHKPSSPAPFKKQHQSKENDVIADFVIQRYKRRKYKSKCRCERIWNCPRIQISIASFFFLCVVLLNPSPCTTSRPFSVTSRYHHTSSKPAKQHYQTL